MIDSGQSLVKESRGIDSQCVVLFHGADLTPSTLQLAGIFNVSDDLRYFNEGVR